MENLTKSKLDEQVRIRCYNQWETMTRREGMEKYLEGMRCCDGSERERYQNIFFALLDGEMIATDS